jgi:hypothetical protein
MVKSKSFVGVLQKLTIDFEKSFLLSLLSMLTYRLPRYKREMKSNKKRKISLAKSLVRAL